MAKNHTQPAADTSGLSTLLRPGPKGSAKMPKSRSNGTRPRPKQAASGFRQWWQAIQSGGNIQLRPHHVPTKDLSWMASKLATASATGVSLSRTMELAAAQKPHAVIGRVMGECARMVKEGNSLSDSFAVHERELGSISVAMVRAGEVSGTLDNSLFKLAEMFDQRQELNQSLAQALSYPALEFVLIILVAVATLIWVVPKFEGFFQELNGHLPTLTQIIVDISNFLRNNWWVMPLALVLIVVGWMQARSNQSSRLMMDEIALRIPVVGKVLKAAALAQLASTLSTLLSSGLPIRDSLSLAKETTWNQSYRNSLERIQPRVVQQGVPLSTAIADENLDMELALAIQTGEETGEVAQVLERFAHANLRWAQNMTKSLAGSLQPISVLILGALVGVLVLAFYLPELNLIKLI
jgi:type IV pilus assembly protein PilC